MAGKAELVDRIAELVGLPKTKVALCYEYLFEEMGKFLKKEGKVSVPGFGTFQVATRKARQGRNPATGKAIKIAASKTVRFKVSKTLKEKL